MKSLSPVAHVFSVQASAFSRCCRVCSAVSAALLTAAALLLSQPPETARLGKQPDGSTLLSTGWRIQPVGDQINSDSFPIASALSRDGKFLLVLDAGRTSIIIFETTAMKETARVPLAGVGFGLIFGPGDKFVYVASGLRASVREFSFANGELKPTREMSVVAQPSPTDFVGDVAASPDGRLLYVTDLFHDTVLVINPQSGRVIERYKSGRRPYRILFDPDGKSYFVTSWAEGTLYQYDASTGNEMNRLRLGPHTTDIVLSDRKVPAESEGASSSRYRLFITSSNSNNVFSVGVDDQKNLKQLELLNVGMVPAQPAGMTPSALALTADQTKLYVVCSDANVVAAIDISEARSRIDGYIPTGAYPTAVRLLPGSRLAILNGQSGTMSVIPSPNDDALAAYTRAATELSRYSPTMAGEQPNARSLFDHVVYILNGSLPGPIPAPDFVRFSNFHVNTPWSPQMWATAAISPALYVRLAASGVNLIGEPANLPPAGYLWSNARAAGLTVRNYGIFVQNGRVTDPSLAGITNLNFKGDDAERTRVFLEDLKQFEASGMMPRLILLRIDKAGGEAAIVEAISKSRFWPKTVVLVAGEIEPDNDAGAGLLVLSPYTRRAIVDNTFYNQTSVLRTIELILGLRPMTMFDAAARPLTSAFGSTPDTTPFTAEKP